MLEKETELKNLLQTATMDHSLPGEREWRMSRAMRGFPVHQLQPRAPSLSSLLLMVYSGLKASENLRREKLELYQLFKDTFLKRVSAERGITPEEMTMLYTMLWDVHRETNPAAIKPQSATSDSLVEDMKRNQAIFNAPLRITV